MPRLQNIDALRGIAASVVLFQHLFGRIWREMPAETAWLKAVSLDYFDWGRFGVVLFFLISGYVIPLSFSGATPVRKFLVGRAFRLYPAFWLAVLAMAFALAVSGAVVPIKQLAANLTMVYPLFRQPAMSGVYWTLIVELMFYALALALFLGRSLERPFVLAAVAMAAVASAVLPLVALRQGINVPTSLLGYHLSFLLLGSLIRLSLAKVNGSREATIAVGVLLAATLPLVSGVFGQNGPVYSNATPFGAMASVVAAVTVFLFAWKPRFERQPAATLRLGAWSYSLYLLHEPIATLMDLVVKPATPISALVFFVTSVAFSTIAAWLVFKWVETPANRLGKKISRRSETTTDAISAAQGAAFEKASAVEMK